MFESAQLHRDVTKVNLLIQQVFFFLIVHPSATITFLSVTKVWVVKQSNILMGGCKQRANFVAIYYYLLNNGIVLRNAWLKIKKSEL